MKFNWLIRFLCRIGIHYFGPVKTGAVKDPDGKADWTYFYRTCRHCHTQIVACGCDQCRDALDRRELK